MDFNSIATVLASVKTAQELASAALGVRDFNQSAATIAQINEKLLAAQQGLLAHNTMLLQLQQEYFEATKELRELKEAVSEKSRYSLFEISPGYFAYRVNLVPQEGGTGEPGSAEPLHYLCQPCFDKGTKSVLQSRFNFGIGYGRCNICSAEVDTGVRRPYL